MEDVEAAAVEAEEDGFFLGVDGQGCGLLGPGACSVILPCHYAILVHGRARDARVSGAPAGV